MLLEFFTRTHGYFVGSFKKIRHECHEHHEVIYSERKLPNLYQLYLIYWKLFFFFFFLISLFSQTRTKLPLSIQCKWEENGVHSTKMDVSSLQCFGLRSLLIFISVHTSHLIALKILKC